MLFLGPLGETPAQAIDRCSACLCLSNLLEVTSDLQFVAASVGPGCVLKGPKCTSRPAFTSIGSRGKPAKHPKATWDLPLSAGSLLDSITD